MPRTTPIEELKLIESIVAGHPNGLGISASEAEIERRQGGKFNRRALQRRLQKLIDQQRLTTEGEGSDQRRSFHLYTARCRRNRQYSALGQQGESLPS